LLSKVAFFCQAAGGEEARSGEVETDVAAKSRADEATPSLGCDTVLGVEEDLQVGGECGGEFLPGEELEAWSEVRQVDGRKHGIPDFDEIVAAGVAEDAEGCVGGVGGEDVADELIALDAGLGWTAKLERVG